MDESPYAEIFREASYTMHLWPIEHLKMFERDLVTMRLQLMHEYERRRGEDEHFLVMNGIDPYS